MAIFKIFTADIILIASDLLIFTLNPALDLKKKCARHDTLYISLSLIVVPFKDEPHFNQTMRLYWIFFLLIWLMKFHPHDFRVPQNSCFTFLKTRISNRPLLRNVGVRIIVTFLFLRNDCVRGKMQKKRSEKQGRKQKINKAWPVTLMNRGRLLVFFCRSDSNATPLCKHLVVVIASLSFYPEKVWTSGTLLSQIWCGDCAGVLRK